MSEGQPAAPTTAPAPVAKIPMKVPMKMPMKMPMKVPMAAPPKPVAPTQPVAAAPKPVVKAAPTMGIAKRVVRDNDDDDDDVLGLGGDSPVKKKPVAAAPVAVKKEKVVVKKERTSPARPVQRGKRNRDLSSDSSDSDDDDRVRGGKQHVKGEIKEEAYDPSNPEAENLYSWAKRMGWLEEEIDPEELQEDASAAKVPKPIKVPWKKSIAATIEDIDKRIEKIEHIMKIKEGTSEVSLGTSKTNYIDPRICVAWCKREKVPVDRVFSKTLCKKFPWAMDTEEDYRF